MRIPRSRLPSLLAASILIGLVGGCPVDDDDTGDDDTAGGPCEAGGTVALADANNYTIASTLDIRHYELADLSDPLFSWGDLTHDLQGHPLDPTTEIDVFAAAVFRYLSEEEVIQGLSTNTLDQGELAIYVLFETGGATEAHLSEMTMFGGTDIDVEQYYEASYGTWLFTLNTGTTPAQGTRMAAFFEPTAGCTTEEMSFENDSTSVDVDADLTSLTTVQVPLGATFTLDWGDLTTDGSGNDIQLGNIDQLMIARYDGTTPAELQDQILDLEIIASEIWTFDLPGGSDADLAALTADSGTFDGVSADGTWVLALRCSTCANPTPPFLSVLQACE